MSQFRHHCQTLTLVDFNPMEIENVKLGLAKMEYYCIGYVFDSDVLAVELFTILRSIGYSGNLS